MATETPTAAEAVARLHALQVRIEVMPSLRCARREHALKIYKPDDTVDADLRPSEIVTCKANPQDQGKLWFFDADDNPLIQANDIPWACHFFAKRLR